VFKYEAGMQNAACDADYADYTTKNADGSWTINID